MAKNRKFKQSIKRQFRDQNKSRSCHLKSQNYKSEKRSKTLKDLAELNKKFVINLSNETFTDAELSVLGRGLKFIHVPKKPSAIQLDGDTEAFMRKMRIRYLMSNSKKSRTHKFKRPSNWHPIPTPCSDLENYLIT